MRKSSNGLPCFFYGVVLNRIFDFGLFQPLRLRHLSLSAARQGRTKQGFWFISTPPPAAPLPIRCAAGEDKARTLVYFNPSACGTSPYPLRGRGGQSNSLGVRFSPRTGEIGEIDMWSFLVLCGEGYGAVRFVFFLRRKFPAVWKQEGLVEMKRRLCH